MAAGPVVFVEGRDDKRFFHCLLERIGLRQVSIARIGGGVSALRHVAPSIRRRRDEGGGIAVVLDADDDFGARRDEFIEENEALGLEIDRFFLMPDHRNPGCLETVLEALAVRAHRGIHECFTQYQDCLLERGREYVVPSPKTRIYAYCEALGVEPRGPERDYCDSGCWNLEAPLLDPLKNFLRNCANPT